MHVYGPGKFKNLHSESYPVNAKCDSEWLHFVEK